MIRTAATAASSDGDATPIEELRSQARTQVFSAVEKLPLERNQAYLEAVNKVPLLCETESDPLAFLRRCDYNVEAAAERLCLYWRERVDLFQERAHLPLNLLGDGALTDDDVMSLMAGWPVVLPKTRSGQHVMFSDRRQFHPVATPESRLRCLFYVNHISALDERTLTEGILVLALAMTPRAPKIDQEFANRALLLCRDVFPPKCSFHHFNLAAGPDRRYEVQDTAAQVLDGHLRRGSKLDDVEVHFERESSKEGFLAVLHELGLTSEGIPASLGGSWTFDSHTEWCRARKRAERQMQLIIPPAGRRRAKKAAADATADESEKKDAATRRKERNVIYSRRKRERRKKEKQDLEEAQSQLESEKEYLLAERKRLEELLSQAQELVDAATNGEDKKPSVEEKTN